MEQPMSKILTDRERAILDDIRKQEDKLDFDFITRSFASALLKTQPEGRVLVISAALDAIGEVYVNACKTVIFDVLHEKRITVDEGMDILGKLTRASIFMQKCAMGIKWMAEPDEKNPGPVGMLTPDDAEVNSLVEETRTMCVRVLAAERAKRRKMGDV